MWNWLKNLFKKKKIKYAEPRKPIQGYRPVGDRLLTNMAGINLIKEFEGFYSTPYKCPAGVWTIGYGTIEYPNGDEVERYDQPIGEATAVEYLKHEINEKENAVERYLKSIEFNYTLNEFAALVSFAYNLGTGCITQTHRTMNKALRSKDRGRIADAFLVYNKARVNGKLKALRGLTRRRKAERELFIRG